MSSVVLHSVSKAVCFVTLIFGAALVPALATTITISLVPAITTLTGNGSPGYPGTSPTLASGSADESPIAVVADPKGTSISPTASSFAYVVPRLMEALKSSMQMADRVLQKTSGAPF